MNKGQIFLVHCLLIQHVVSLASKHIQIHDCCCFLPTSNNMAMCVLAQLIVCLSLSFTHAENPKSAISLEMYILHVQIML